MALVCIPSGVIICARITDVNFGPRLTKAYDARMDFILFVAFSLALLTVLNFSDLTAFAWLVPLAPHAVMGLRLGDYFEPR